MRAAWAVLPLLAVTACGPQFDAPSLAEGVGTTFANLYVRAEAQQGRADVTVASLDAVTTCTRGGAGTPDAGPGDDWSCLVTVTDAILGAKQVRYEVTLKPEGCFTAEGPPPVVGDAKVVDAQGVLRLNPVYAFDGCL